MAVITAYVSPEDLHLVAGILHGIAGKLDKVEGQLPDYAQAPAYLSEVFQKLACRMGRDGRVELRFIPAQQRQGVAA